MTLLAPKSLRQSSGGKVFFRHETEEVSVFGRTFQSRLGRPERNRTGAEKNLSSEVDQRPTAARWRRGRGTSTSLGSASTRPTNRSPSSWRRRAGGTRDQSLKKCKIFCSTYLVMSPLTAFMKSIA